MGNSEISRIGAVTPDLNADFNLYYGKIYNDLKERVFAAQREGKVNFRNPGGKKVASSPRIEDGISKKIQTTEFYVSPEIATLDIENLNEIAFDIAFNPSQVREGFCPKTGKLIQKEGIIFPEIVADEMLSEIEKQVDFNIVEDPYDRAGEFIREEKYEQAIDKSFISRVRYIQRTRIIIFPTKHLAHLKMEEDPLVSKMEGKDIQKGSIGLLPNAVGRLKDIMKKRDINSLPPGEIDWLDEIFW